MQQNADNYELFKRWIAHRIAKNKNVLIITLGSTGSGKSFSNLRILEDIDNQFNVDRAAFKPEEFMNIVDSGILRKKGAGVLYDDAGITLNSKNWYDITNKMINYYLQIARSDNQILMFNTPDMSFLDASSRKLFHMMLVTAGIDYEKGVVRLKPKFLQTNKTTGKVYAKYLIVKKGVGYGSKRKIKMIEVPLPSQDLKRHIIDSIATRNLKELTDRQLSVLNAKKAGISKEEIAKQMDISVRTVYKHEEALKKKGFDVEKGGTGA